MKIIKLNHSHTLVAVSSCVTFQSVHDISLIHQIRCVCESEVFSYEVAELNMILEYQVYAGDDVYLLPALEKLFVT